MDEISQMGKEIRRLTLALALICSGLSVVFFHGRFQEIGMGIILGALTGIIGFSMITNMTNRIELYGNPKRKGTASYVQRYALYAIIFSIAAVKGVHVVALLVGFLLHKGAILVYVVLHRKED